MQFDCLSCGSRTQLEAYARVAPFISELMNWQVENEPETLLQRCDGCELVFFSFRFDESIMEALYSQYRGDSYLTVRKKWEPWYSQSINSALEPGQPAVEERIRFMMRVLEGRVDLDTLKSIADLGGDAGQFIPHEFSGRKYLVEVSDRNRVPGITAVQSLEDVEDGGPDLVIAAHLLEHVSDPKKLLLDVRANLSPGGWLYVEVPLDQPKLKHWHRRRTYAIQLARLRVSRVAWLLTDLLTGIMRNLGRSTPRIGIVKQSEHINYFNATSLRKLLENTGFRVVGIQEEPNARLQGLRMGRLGILAVPQKHLPKSPTSSNA